MAELEKVIEGLEHCEEHECKGCPYYLGTDGSFFCVGKRLRDDALELLKEQRKEMAKQPNIVRCKYCKHNSPFGCEKHNVICSDNFFCADGEYYQNKT